MSPHKRFHLRDLEHLRQELADLGLQLPIEQDLSILAEPVRIDRLETPNRFTVQPMEGFDSAPDGSPRELTFRRYRRYAEGGSGLIWFEATAVLNEARSNPHQAYLHRRNVDAYARLVDATRAAARQACGHELVLIVQLTHSGRYSKPTGRPQPIIAHHSPILDPQHDLPEDYPLASDEYLDRLQETYLEAAGLAARAGFDGVDLKSCHRYLVSELLASHTREGKYGGPLENRVRLLCESLERIRQEVSGLFVTTRMNVYDAIPYPYGFGVDRDNHLVPDLSEPIELLRRLVDIGIPLVNVSIGNPYYNPHFGRPYDRPVAGVNVPEEHPLAAVVRFIEITRTVQETFPQLPVIASGYGWLRHLMPCVAAGVIRSKGATLVGQGRGAFAYPDSVRDILTTGGMDPARTCVTCSGCTQIMRDGTMAGCVVRDSAIYGPQYRLGRRFAVDHLREEARRCQECELATCTAGCPAHVDVPAFIRAFADDDTRTAYDVLRRTNVLPEMCAFVCPSEVQCEGGCLERVFTEHALPIRDIQLVVSRMAREEGIVGVRLPAASSGRHVAVVGGGPAGLACAIRLLEMGHTVALYEKGDRLGGTPEGIIPGVRYEHASEEVEAILTPAKSAARIRIELGRALGRDVSLERLRAEFDAVFLAMGLGRSSSLGEADGVIDALSFLAAAKQGKVPSIDGRVAVLGAGNTAMDAAATAHRLGAKDVYVVYRRSFAEMPAWPSEREEVLELGCHLLILTQPMGYETDAAGKLTGLRVARTELGSPDASGRRSPQVVPNTESVMEVDLVIEAMGQAIPPEMRKALGDLEFTENGLLATRSDSQETSATGVFAGGDLVNGGTTAVQGITEGMRAAGEIDEWLTSSAADCSSPAE